MFWDKSSNCSRTLFTANFRKTNFFEHLHDQGAEDGGCFEAGVLYERRLRMGAKCGDNRAEIKERNSSNFPASKNKGCEQLPLEIAKQNESRAAPSGGY